MRKWKNWFKALLYLFLGFIGLVACLFVYLYCVAIVNPPKPGKTNVLSLNRTKIDKDCYVLGNNWIRKSESGLWEMYVEGDPYERGVINGKLSADLVYYQEKVFNEQICKLVPSNFYRHFLKYFIAWFNRDLDKQLTQEQKLEIYGVSQSASSEFDYIGSPYQRLLNYHAAHDMGHALQNMALVGCSSFATWNSRSKDSLLILGRNFDFYVGDKFAENKIVLFCNPDKGYKFMTIAWGGMTGVVSGMNLQGLTITLNSDKSEVPTGAATPVSILAREILQYASNIDEAIKIAKIKKTFVSESFLVSSAKDKKAVIIEKTPESFDVYDPKKEEIVCTNHYQSPGLKGLESNKLQIEKSASVYRHDRIVELLKDKGVNSVEKTIEILRDQRGTKNQFIGYGNEKAVNQLICHHSIVFEPEKNLVWVSTFPWNLGKYVAYDLNKIFGLKGLKENKELYEPALTIKPDTFYQSIAYKNFVEFRKLKEDIQDKKEADVKKLVTLDPEFYHSYVLAGNYEFHKKNYKSAESFYKQALTKEIATINEKDYINKQIQSCKKEMQ